MNEFLKKIASDIKNTGKVFTSEDFYYILKYLGVKKDVSLVNDIEKFYEDFLSNLNNSLVRYEEKTLKSGDNATHYIGFYAIKSADYLEAVKVYFPVRYEYLISALKTIFLYLVRNNIEAVVKFHVKETNEGIVIRFYQKSDVMPFINYCNNNFILKDLLLSANPFIPTIYGIGLLRDDNIVNTYNGTLSVLLEDYFKLLTKNKTLDKASDIEFVAYIIEREQKEKVPEIKFNMNSIIMNMKTIMNHDSPLARKDLL